MVEQAERLRIGASEARGERACEPTRQPSKPRHCGQRTEAAAPARQIEKTRIAGKKLVATEPGERHFQSCFLRRLRYKPGVHTIDGGLIHRIENRRQVVVEFLLAHTSHDVAGAIMPGYARSKRRFVLVRTGELLEGKRDRADIALASV